MRRNFFIYLGALAASIIMARLRPGFVSTMIFYMMVCLPIAELVMIAMTYVSFKISHAINKRTVLKGEKVNYELALVNPTVLLFAPLKVYYTGSDLLFRQSNLHKNNTILMYPFSREQFEKEIQCDYRGSYYVGVERVEVQGFFRFFYFDYTGMETLKILVHPNIHELKAVNFHHALSESTESIVSFDKFDKSIFSELRTYQPGDPLNKIHWKLSARSNELITKEYEGNVNNKTKIFVNTEATHQSYEQNIVIEDYLIEGAVAISKYLLENNTPTEMIWYDNKSMRLRGEHGKDFQPFYDALALMRFSEGVGSCEKMIIEETGNQYDQCVIMLFTSHVTPELSEVLYRKKRQGFEVNLVTLKLNELVIGGKEVEINTNPIYRLMDNGIRVYHMTFEDGICRLEVA